MQQNNVMMADEILFSIITILVSTTQWSVTSAQTEKIQSGFCKYNSLIIGQFSMH